MTKMRRTQIASPVGLVFALAAFSAGGCSEPVSAPTIGAVAARGGGGGPVVSSFAPMDAPQHITIDLTVTGSGFDKGSWVRLEKGGNPASGVTTNSTTFISSNQLVANITITEQAAPDYYDVAVIASSGKRGIGAERFEVLDVLWLGPLDGQRLYQATAINDLNHAAGWSWNSPFFWSAAGQAEWLQGDVWGAPTGINDQDVVVGNTCGYPASINTSCGPSQQYGVIWQRSNGAWTTTPITAPGTLLVDITNAGELFGIQPGPRAWRRNTNLQIQLLPLPAGRDTAGVRSANNTGQAVGDDLFWSFELDGAVRVLVLPAPSGGTRPAAVDVGDADGGQVFVVGNAFFKGYRQPVRWRLGLAGGVWQVIQAERLGVPFRIRSWDEGAARGVNRAGDAVGWFYQYGVARPIRWPASGTPTVLPHPDRQANSMATAINNLGWIAGYVEAPYEGAVVWRVR